MKFFSVLLFAFSISVNTKPVTVRKYFIEGLAQGTSYHITYYSSDSSIRQNHIDSIFLMMDSSLSIYKPFSRISLFNKSVQGIETDSHLKNVIQKAELIYQKTNKLFDITVLPLTNLWGFGPAESLVYPDSNAITNTLKCIGTSGLHWENNKLLKKRPCIQLDVNGIAQGYSVDVIADFLQQNNIHDYLIELGGEIRVKGRKQPENLPMSIGIESPDNDNLGEEEIKKIVWMKEGAITTSGNYRKYIQADGKRRSHIINPITGYPVDNDLISVSVYAADAITADAYDNALMLMGLESAIKFVERSGEISAYFIYRKNDGSVADTMSSQFYKLLQP
jgi:FAD:protein FMN transferase